MRKNSILYYWMTLGLFAFTSQSFAQEDLSKIPWETNNNDPSFAAENVVGGGSWLDYMLTYPLTFRLYGPNANDSFAGWNRSWCFMGLVERHPNTEKFIPMLATHWAVMPDQKTVYFKLDPEVRFSDGKPLTADDYVFAYEMMLSPHINDTFYNRYYGERFEKVEKLDPYTLKIVGKHPSWRALSEYQVTPVAKHATELNESWVRRTNWEPPVCVGPYKYGKIDRGKSVQFVRIKDWWGDKKRYLKNRFSFDSIEIKVIRDNDVAFEVFKKDAISSYFVGTASVWAQKTDFDAVQKGWIIKRKVFNRIPQGTYGIAMNVQDPMLQDKNIRKALQYLFDFEKINKQIMFSSYVRKTSVFGGTPYENPRLKPYPFDLEKAQEYLQKSGWKTRGNDGILTNDKGQRLSLTLTLGAGALEKHMSIYQEDLKKAGIELKIKLVDPATDFRFGMERNFQLSILSRSGGYYPDPEQFFHSSFGKTKGNNNVFGYINSKADQLIEVYNRDLDFKKRQKALYELDDLIHDDAILIEAWTTPYVRMLFWNRFGMPKTIIEKLSSNINDNQTFFLDPRKDAALREAVKLKQALPVMGAVEYDPFNLKR